MMLLVSPRQVVYFYFGRPFVPLEFMSPHQPMLFPQLA